MSAASRENSARSLSQCLNSEAKGPSTKHRARADSPGPCRQPSLSSFEGRHADAPVEKVAEVVLRRARRVRLVQTERAEEEQDHAAHLPEKGHRPVHQRGRVSPAAWGQAGGASTQPGHQDPRVCHSEVFQARGGKEVGPTELFTTHLPHCFDGHCPVGRQLKIGATCLVPLAWLRL